MVRAGRLQKRRDFLIASSALLAVPGACYAQTAQKIHRIGFLSGYPLRNPQFPPALAALGYEDGKNLTIDWRVSTNSAELANLAKELVRQRVELVVAGGNEAIAAICSATRDIPVVMLSGTNPVEQGWVRSLSHPGGNVTGAIWSDPAQAAKTFDVLRDAAPHARRIAVTFNPTFPFAKIWTDGYDRAAEKLGMKLDYFPIVRPTDVEPALKLVAAARPDALFVSIEAVQAAQIKKFVEFAIERKLVMVSNTSTVVEQGALVSHSPDSAAIRLRVWSFVDRILRGAKPGDLPVELPTKFEVVFNAKTARAIGYTVPPVLQLRIDRTIE